MLPQYATVNGVVDATATNNTVNTGDVINGNGATNTFNVTVASAATAGLITLNNVSTVNVRALGAANIDALLYTGVQNFNSNNSSAAITLTNATLNTVYGLANTVPATQANLSITYQAAQVAGSSDVAQLALKGGVGSSIVATGAVAPTVTSPVVTFGSGIESVQLTTSGVNYATISGASAINTLNVSGSGTNVLNVAALGTTLSINAATSTGNNTFDLGAGLSTGDTVVGGTGTDAVRGTLNGTVTGVSLTNVETFRLNATSTGTVAFAANPGITTLADHSGSAVAVTGITTLSNLNLVGDATTAAQSLSSTTFNTSFSGAADNLAVTLSNQGQASSTYSATLNATGLETLSFTQADATANTTTTLTIASATGTSVTGTSALAFTSLGNVNIGTVGATTTPTAGGSLTSINATGVAGVFTATTADASLANGATITLGAGGTTGNQLTVGAEAATDVLNITGGAGIDNVTVNAGNFTANLGAGNDVFNGAAATSFSAYGEAGNDTITASQGTDTIVGGTGQDTAVFAVGTSTAATKQVDTSTVSITAGSIQVTVNGTTYSTAFDTNTATTLTAFNAAHGAAIVTALGAGSATAVTGTTIVITGASTGAAFTASAAVAGAGTAATVVTTPGAAASTTAGTSTLTNLDLLTYINADGDIIDLGATAVTIQTSTGTAGSVAAISATGLATFLGTSAQQPTSLNQAASFVEAGIQTGTPTAGQSAVFVYNNQAYLFTSDGVDGLSTTADVLVTLTGITSLSTGMTLAGGDITSIS